MIKYSLSEGDRTKLYTYQKKVGVLNAYAEDESPDWYGDNDEQEFYSILSNIAQKDHRMLTELEQELFEHRIDMLISSLSDTLEIEFIKEETKQ